MAAHKNLGTWSKTSGSNKKHNEVWTQFVFDIKHDTEGMMTRYKARLVAQSFNQGLGRDMYETWALVPNLATTRSLFAVAAATGWEIHHVDVQTAFFNPEMDEEMYIKLPDGVNPRGLEEICRPNLALYEKKQAGRL